MDRLTSLAVFAAVVECGGFSAAARRLNMSATAVSSHVQALEDRLGVRLLNRTTRRVSLTEVGRAYYERSSRIISDIDDADRIATALHDTPRGSLKLYMGTHIVRFLAPVVSEYLELYPATSVDVTIGEAMVDLIEGGYDLAVRAVPPPESSFTVRGLTPWRHILCCAPAYLALCPEPTQPADLAHHNCLRYAQYPFGDEWRFEAPGGHESVRVGGNVVTNSAELLRLLAIRGSGIFLAPSFLVVDDLGSGALRRLLPDRRPVELGIKAIFPHRHNLSAKVRSFIDLLAERLAAHREWSS